MSMHQMLVILGMVLLQVSGANAQFGSLGNLIDKVKDIKKPAEKPADQTAQQPATDQPEAKEDFSSARGCFDILMHSSDPESRYKAFSRIEYYRGGLDKAECHYYLAECYIRGIMNGHSAVPPGASSSNPQPTVKLLNEAIPEYEKAAKLEHIPSLVKLSAIYADEKSELKDLNKSLSCLVVAARLGDKASLDKLSQLYAAGFAGVSDGNDKDKSVEFLAGVGNHDAQIEFSNKLASAEALKKQQAALDEALKQKQQEEAKLAAEKALQEQRLADVASSKEIRNAIEHPKDLFGINVSRYRKFNGKVYDCAEPIETLNKYFAYLSMVDKYGSESDKLALLYSQSGYETKSEDGSQTDNLTEVQKVLKDTNKLLRSSQWGRKGMDYVLAPPFVVRQVTSDGLIVQGNAPNPFLLKNHPKQKESADGDLLSDDKVWFALKTSPYQYTDVNGAIRTIKSYDLGVIVPAPSGSVPKLTTPEADR